jgi:hypothetical protein
VGLPGVGPAALPPPPQPTSHSPQPPPPPVPGRCLAGKARTPGSAFNNAPRAAPMPSRRFRSGAGLAPGPQALPMPAAALVLHVRSFGRRETLIPKSILAVAKQLII